MFSLLPVAGNKKLSTYQQVVLSDSPYAFYPLTETSGTVANDISGHARNGTYGSGMTLASSTMFGSSSKFAYFPGNSTAVVSIGAAEAFIGSSWTFECWYNVTAFDTGEAGANGEYRVASIISNSSANTNHLNFGAANTSNSNANAYWYHPSAGGDKYTNANSIPAAGTTAYLAVTYSTAGALSVYLNGTLLESFAGTTNATALSPLQIGGLGYVCAPLNGYVGNFAVYSTALSAARISAHYSAI
jgi:hypothetical protein